MWGPGMRRSVSIPIVATLLLNACHPIVVRVGKRSQDVEAVPSLPYHSEADITRVASWNSVEDFLLHLDEIKQLGRDALLKRYHADGRQQIRRTFRQFRDAVENQASRGAEPQLPYLGELEAGTCVPISTRDIFDLDAYGDLQSLLETVFLSRIKPSESIPDPALPGGMDELTKLGFFELGIAMDGPSFYVDDGKTEIQGSDLSWKVIHEQNESDAWVNADQRRVRFRFVRMYNRPNRTNFVLEAQVSSEADEPGQGESLPSLWLDYEKIIENQGHSFQAMNLQTGWRDSSGHWNRLQMSRRIVVSQDIYQGHILHVSAIEHWQKPEAMEKKFRLDMDARHLCSELGGS